MSEQIKSILTATKKALGIVESYEHYDPEIIMHINSVFSTLQQLGVGPEAGYSIIDASEEWDDFFTTENKLLNSVKSYMYLKVRLLFDPPATSFAIDALKDQAREYEWRFTVVHDSATIASNVVVTP